MNLSRKHRESRWYSDRFGDSRCIKKAPRFEGRGKSGMRLIKHYATVAVCLVGITAILWIASHQGEAALLVDQAVSLVKPRKMRPTPEAMQAAQESARRRKAED